MHDKVMRAHDAALIKRVQATMALLTRPPTLPGVASLAIANPRQCLLQGSKPVTDGMQSGTLAQMVQGPMNSQIDCFVEPGFSGTAMKGRDQAAMPPQVPSAKSGGQRRDRPWQTACLPSRLDH